jgi:hypothetical protein
MSLYKISCICKTNKKNQSASCNSILFIVKGSQTNIFFLRMKTKIVSYEVIGMELILFGMLLVAKQT